MNEQNKAALAIDAKMHLESAATEEELLAMLIATGVVPPTEDMPIKKARQLYTSLLRSFAGMNFLQQMYQESLDEHRIAVVASAYPYVLQKTAEEKIVHVDDQIITDLSDEERDAIKKLNASILRDRMKQGVMDE